MSGTREEKLLEMQAAYQKMLSNIPEEMRQDFYDMIREEGENDIALWYHPDPRLKAKVDNFSAYCRGDSGLTPQKAGYLLEEIISLIFYSLKGVKHIKSYQSSGPQYDLLVYGDEFWKVVFSRCKLPAEKYGILVEAKAEKERIPEKYFSRLSCIINDNFSKTVGLGIFFSVNGASGFPKSNDPKRRRCVADSRLRQVITYAKHGIPIIVFDLEDIVNICEPGSLIKCIESKVRDIEQLTGLRSCF